MNPSPLTTTLCAGALAAFCTVLTYVYIGILVESQENKSVSWKARLDENRESKTFESSSLTFWSVEMFMLLLSIWFHQMITLLTIKAYRSPIILPFPQSQTENNYSVFEQITQTTTQGEHTHFIIQCAFLYFGLVRFLWFSIIAFLLYPLCMSQYTAAFTFLILFTAFDLGIPILFSLFLVCRNVEDF